MGCLVGYFLLSWGILVDFGGFVKGSASTVVRIEKSPGRALSRSGLLGTRYFVKVIESRSAFSSELVVPWNESE